MARRRRARKFLNNRGPECRSLTSAHCRAFAGLQPRIPRHAEFHDEDVPQEG
jgi:hypothetical protein